MWRSIWRGPFYVGPLAHPVSTGSAIMRLLEVLWKAAVAVVALAAVAAMAISFLIWQSDKRDRADRAQMAEISVYGNYAPRICGPAKPFSLRAINNSSKAVKGFYYDATGYDEYGGIVAHASYQVVHQAVPAQTDARICVASLPRSFDSAQRIDIRITSLIR